MIFVPSQVYEEEQSMSFTGEIQESTQRALLTFSTNNLWNITILLFIEPINAEPSLRSIEKPYISQPSNERLSPTQSGGPGPARSIYQATVEDPNSDDSNVP